jgi:hypothetical protein
MSAGLAVALVAIALVVVVGWIVFGRHLTAQVQSISPDGMFRCTVTEWSVPGNAQPTIVIERATDGNMGIHSEDSHKPWQGIKQATSPGDSAFRSSYSIAWQYDGNHRTTEVTVFGDYGTPPFPGTILLEMPLAGRNKLGD